MTVAEPMIPRIPLNIVVTATGHETEGVLCAVAVDDLVRLETMVEDLRVALELAKTPMTEQQEG